MEQCVYFCCCRLKCVSLLRQAGNPKSLREDLPGKNYNLTPNEKSKNCCRYTTARGEPEPVSIGSRADSHSPSRCQTRWTGRAMGRPCSCGPPAASSHASPAEASVSKVNNGRLPLSHTNTRSSVSSASERQQLTRIKQRTHFGSYHCLRRRPEPRTATRKGQPPLKVLRSVAFERLTSELPQQPMVAAVNAHTTLS